MLSPSGDNEFRKHLYLFNVLVALEWYPDERTLKRLRVAFRRASDFLFDITDGWMAFGQVVFGGPELMASADIQILASNRVLPRSWVGGLHKHDEYKNDEKYQPIRIGRGLWSDISRKTFTWDEPEGYRVIIHEWGHYALELTDEYLETRDLVSLAHRSSAQLANQLVSRAPTKVVMLQIATDSNSIMSTTEGTSELVTGQWKELRKLFPALPKEQTEQTVRDGPEQLPIELPSFRYTKELQAQTTRKQFVLSKWKDIRDALRKQVLLYDLPLDQCWVYILKGITDEQPYPSQIIAQGTLEARSEKNDFPLLGADAGDRVIVIGQRRNQTPIVLSAKLTNTANLSWSVCTPPALPVIDIIPEEVQANNPRAKIRVRLTYQGDQRPQQVCIYPIGQPASQAGRLLGGDYTPGWTSDPLELPSLDGHILMRWAGDLWMLTTFSQGGDGPNSSHPFPTNPMNAGSSDGNALLLMHTDTEPDSEPNDIKVVTTMIHSPSFSTPNAAEQLERSYTFGVASNQPLPLDLNPSLLMYYDRLSEQELLTIPSGELRICRWSNNQGWVAIPSYIPEGFRFAIAPLNEESGGRLISPLLLEHEARVEYYKVCWIVDSQQAARTEMVGT